MRGTTTIFAGPCSGRAAASASLIILFTAVPAAAVSIDASPAEATVSAAAPASSHAPDEGGFDPANPDLPAARIASRPSCLPPAADRRATPASTDGLRPGHRGPIERPPRLLP
ncbi:MAG: hypothetical protein QME96_04290 [Myxococcota bacterium]|nr:hypothetical protein [Myxococcota bacterium]